MPKRRTKNPRINHYTKLTTYYNYITYSTIFPKLIKLSAAPTEMTENRQTRTEFATGYEAAEYFTNITACIITLY